MKTTERKTTRNIGLTSRDLVFALVDNNLSPTKAYKDLDISPGTFYYHTNRNPQINTLAKKVNTLFTANGI